MLFRSLIPSDAPAAGNLNASSCSLNPIGSNAGDKMIPGPINVDSLYPIPECQVRKWRTRYNYSAAAKREYCELRMQRVNGLLTEEEFRRRLRDEYIARYPTLAATKSYRKTLDVWWRDRSCHLRMQDEPARSHSTPEGPGGAAAQNQCPSIAEPLSSRQGSACAVAASLPSEHRGNSGHVHAEPARVGCDEPSRSNSSPDGGEAAQPRSSPRGSGSWAHYDPFE